ncbi:MAG TPA: FixH family protein [Flavobacterium sp.]|uniref:FixH family protein n=1 Tax=Flavobacterium sp. TaxID=239 RepID=UPI002D0C8B59|nr:FixH family protein [Flavobacterium sp.]HNP33530.1 FixH family protein [Flavobacterium sp.]
MKKPNWGTSILIAFVLFMGFILFFVFKVQSNSKYDNELVVDEYYKKDTHYSEEMNKMRNAAQLTQRPSINIQDDGVSIVFPDQITAGNISGDVAFYRPSAKKFDFDEPLKLSGQSMLIKKEHLIPGRWNVTLSWKDNQKKYMIKKELYYN